MRTSDFDYELPEELIAQKPSEKRDQCRLMVVDRKNHTVDHKRFCDILDYLDPSDCLVMNNSKVLPARLFGEKAATGARVEFLLTRHLEGDCWETMVRPGKRLKPGDFVVFGDNFCADINCLDPVPTAINNITSTKLENGIYDRWYLTSDTSEPYPTTIPDQWDYDTIMDADFNGNISAGNVEFTLDEITGFKIKRREVGTFDWITLVELPVATLEDLHLSFNDNLNANFKNYEYALVPVVNDIEGDYITNTVLSRFG